MMGVNEIFQTTSVSDTIKPKADGKQQHKKDNAAAYSFDAGTAVEYTKGSSLDRVVMQDTALIEKMKAEAERNTEQLRSLVEKLLLKQGEKHTSLANLFQKVKDGILEVEPETIQQAKEDVSEDGYWGIEKTSERLFSFAKALSGNDTRHADLMIKAMEKGFRQAEKQWGDALPDICRKTIDAATEKINAWRNEAPAN